MGLLGNIFSTIDTQKRKLTDLLGNPVESIQQIVGNVNDRARNLNELTAAAAQEKDLYGPKSQQLASLLADAYNPIGMMVYHGSPAKFSKFDPTKIGSGEGAQAYGYGHYVAESPAVAREYQKNLANPIKDQTDTAFITARTAFVKGDGDVKKAMKYLDQQQKMTEEASGFLVDKGQKSLSDIEQARGLLKSGAMQPGNMYEIDLPDEQIAKMLDWDKPVSQQKDVMAALNSVAEKNVKAKVRNDIENEIRASGVLPTDKTGDDYMSLLFGQSDETIAKADQMLKQLADEQMAKIDFAPLIKNELEGMKPATMTWDATGKDFYEMLAKRSGSPEKASALFKEQGVPGIRYLDQGSRATPNITNQRLADLYEKHQGNAEAAVDEMMRSVYNTPKKKQEMREAFLKQLETKKTSNFVVFPGNEGLLTIQKRNNEVIAPTSLLDNSKNTFETSVTDASEIFGEGAKRIRYTDPSSGGMIDVLQRPDGTASVLGLEVPEQMRGKGIGQSLQSKVMQDFPEMMGQVSSKAAAKTAYRLGRRPPNQPNASLEDVYKIMDEYSSVNLVSPEMQKRMKASLLD